MSVFFAIMAGILLFGMIGSREKGEKDCYTVAFIADIAAIVAMYIIGW